MDASILPPADSCHPFRSVTWHCQSYNAALSFAPHWHALIVMCIRRWLGSSTTFKGNWKCCTEWPKCGFLDTVFIFLQRKCWNAVCVWVYVCVCHINLVLPSMSLLLWLYIWFKKNHNPVQERLRHFSRQILYIFIVICLEIIIKYTATEYIQICYVKKTSTILILVPTVTLFVTCNIHHSYIFNICIIFYLTLKC